MRTFVIILSAALTLGLPTAAWSAGSKEARIEHARKNAENAAKKSGAQSHSRPYDPKKAAERAAEIRRAGDAEQRKSAAEAERKMNEFLKQR